MSRPFWFLDSRSLALFRIILGLVSLYTFGQLATDAQPFFGPDGILSADFAWNGYSVKPWLFSLLFAFPGSMAPVVLMLALGIAGSLLVLFGPAARLGSLVVWWAFGSLTARNPLVLHAGDSLLSIMLLFGALLPVNRHFALSRRGPQSPILVSNFWSTLWIFQLGVVYLAAGIVKISTPSWLDGTHLTLLLSGTELVTPFGRWLSQYPGAGWFGTVSSLFFEFVLGILIICLPASWQRWRIWLIAVALCFHLMIAVALQVGLFPILSLAALTTLLPPLFWERFRLRLNATPSELPPVQSTCARNWQVAAAVPVGAAIAWMGIANAYPSIPQAPESVRVVFHQIQWKNNWNVFAESPTRRTRLGVEVILKNGGRIDLFEGRTLVPAAFNSLPSESDRFGGSRWRFFLFGNLVNRPQLRPLAGRYLRMLADQHADNADLRGATWELVLYSAPIRAEEPLRLSREVIAVHPPADNAAIPARE